MQGRRVDVGEDRRLGVGDYRVEEPHPDQETEEEEVFEGLVMVLSVGHRQGIYG